MYLCISHARACFIPLPPRPACVVLRVDPLPSPPPVALRHRYRSHRFRCRRRLQLLESSMPSLGVVMSDVLQVDYTKLAELRGGPVSVIGNLPYHITSQVSN